MSDSSSIKLDLGCGKNKREGFIGVDSRPFEGVDLVCDLGKPEWRFEAESNEYLEPVNGLDAYASSFKDTIRQKVRLKSDSVDEVNCSHMVEHLKPAERIHFVNELHRVLKKGGKAYIATPHFASVRAYGDLTHEWPPVVSFWYLYLNAEWRKTNAPHNDAYTCDFDHGYGFGLHPSVQARNQEYQNYAVIHLLEGAQDLHVTLTKR